MIHIDIEKLSNHKIAIFGATGYIGMILAEKLANTSVDAKLFVRNKRRVKYLIKKCKNLTVSDVELTTNNIQKLSQELEGYDTVIYLIHSMTKEQTGSFAMQDDLLASIVGKSSKNASVKNIVYLSGLGVPKKGQKLSTHLASRQHTAVELAKSGVSVTELRAGVIIGDGSASFEIIRDLGTKMPIFPKLSIETGLCQPIDVDAVVSYVFQAIHNEKFHGNTLELGCDEIYKYSEMVKIFSKEIKHRSMPYFPLLFIEKFITKGLISWVISRATSLPIQLIKPLIGGIDSYAIIGEHPVSKYDSNCSVKPLSYLEAIKIATDRENKGETISLWGLPIEDQVYGKKESGHFTFKYNATEINGMLYEERSIKLKDEEIEPIFNEIKCIGGKNGYWSPHFLWQIRGWIDSLLGGPGLSGRIRNYSEIREGERMDFWTISRYINRNNLKKLRLKARMVTPGNSWLEFTITKRDDGNYLILRAYFEPSGMWGYAYWYSLYFVHKYMFTKMINTIYLKALNKKS
ncbi:MAG: DUF2867 domain-containing protein [Campylobacterota bacterium]|nr:DUF2867 domain-containing protein [Campylobacterota bacterium]